MAVFGEIVLLALGIWLLLGAVFLVQLRFGFTGEFEWVACLPFSLGVLMIWCAIHYGPITMSIGA